MGTQKLGVCLKVIEKFTFRNNLNCKNDFLEILGVVMETIQEIEICLDATSDRMLLCKIKLCLLQLQYTVNKMSQVVNDSIYHKKIEILKILKRKIYLCLKEVLNVLSDECLNTVKSEETNYHSLMSSVVSALSPSKMDADFRSLIDNLLCSCLTIAKLSTPQDFLEINSSCKNVLTATSIKAEDCFTEFNNTYFTYHVKILDQKVNTAMLRLFLHIMSYPQQSLKKLVTKCGSCVDFDRFSEDLDDEISDFDLTSDRIGLVGNFALMSTEDESLKLKVQNCMANLEFCEESLIPACIDYYLDPENQNKRDLLKYLSTEWKSEVIQLRAHLDSIVDPASFSLVVLEDLSELIRRLKASGENLLEPVIQDFYRRTQKLIENIDKSPDCSSHDLFLTDLKKSLISELKLNEGKTFGREKISHLEVILSLVDQLSEHLNKILNTCSETNNDESAVINSTLKNLSLNDTLDANDSYQHHTLESICKKWNDSYHENGLKLKRNMLPNHYLEKAMKNSPFSFTMYKKTPVKRKFKDNVTISLEISEFLGQSYEA